MVQGAEDRGTIAYYGRKCREHLARVRLSHYLALSAIREESVHPDASVDQLVRDAFHEESDTALREEKLRSGLNEVHLAALKADFELFLNRIITVVWRNHFVRLREKLPNKVSFSARDFAIAVGNETDARQALIDAVVPSHGLSELLGLLMAATGIGLSTLRSDSNRHQIEVAFLVRHLIEHQDCRADKAFQRQAKASWDKSSWGDRGPLPSVGEKVAVNQNDVVRTHDAMQAAAETLAEALVKWNAHPAA